MNRLIFTNFLVTKGQNEISDFVKYRFRRTANENVTNISNINTGHTTSSVAKQFIDFCNLDVKYTFENVAYACFMGVLLILSFVGNLMVVVAITSSRKLKARVTVYFIVSLAIADFLTAVSVIPFYVSIQFRHNLVLPAFCHSIGACFWMLLGESCGTVASILNLFFIAIDRFIAIRFPFHHRTLFSKKRVKIMICFTWIFAISYPIAGIFPWSSKYARDDTVVTVTKSHNLCANHNRPFFAASFLGIYIVALLVMTITYCIILHIAILQIRAIERTKVDDLEFVKLNENESINGEESKCLDKSAYKKKQRNKRIRRKELKATKSVAIVYFAFLVCWFPACVVNCILLSDPWYFPRLKKNNKDLFLFVWYGLIQIFPMVNTMINPLIYSLSNHQFRNVFKAIYLKMLCHFRNMEFPLKRVSRDTNSNSSAEKSPNAQVEQRKEQTTSKDKHVEMSESQS